jgi:hypothetical protein
MVPISLVRVLTLQCTFTLALLLLLLLLFVVVVAAAVIFNVSKKEV